MFQLNWFSNCPLSLLLGPSAGRNAHCWRDWRWHALSFLFWKESSCTGFRTGEIRRLEGVRAKPQGGRDSNQRITRSTSTIHVKTKCFGFKELLSVALIKLVFWIVCFIHKINCNYSVYYNEFCKTKKTLHMQVTEQDKNSQLIVCSTCDMKILKPGWGTLVKKEVSQHNTHYWCLDISSHISWPGRARYWVLEGRRHVPLRKHWILTGDRSQT